MARQVTIAGTNRYCQARLKAAKYNPDLSIRSKAVEHLAGVSEDSLKKYELDITKPPNDVVALMADAYNAPELRSWYCATECPLGKDARCIEEMPAERIVVRLQNIKDTISRVTATLAAIMDDGVVDDEELEMLPKLGDELREVKRRTEEALAMMERTEKSGRFAD